MENNFKTFFIMRHAEKEVGMGYNPPLSGRGHIRANNLVQIFLNQEIDVIFSTTLLRVRQTLEPLSSNKKVPILEYEAYEIENLIKSIFINPNYKNIIIGGHQDTVPIIANVLLGENRFGHISNEDYDNLFILQSDMKNSRNAIHLKICIP